jgi:uncharacterized protein
MPDDMTADEVRSLLALEPHPTCGYVRLTFLSKQAIAAGGLAPPFAERRPLGSALCFIVTPERAVKLHRIRNDQLYHYYLVVHPGSYAGIGGRAMPGWQRGRCRRRCPQRKG